jgi:hypothetical protein
VFLDHQLCFEKEKHFSISYEPLRRKPIIYLQIAHGLLFLNPFPVTTAEPTPTSFDAA